MTSYLSYESENRKIQILQINVIDFVINYIESSSLEISFVNNNDFYKLLNHFEINNNWNLKYIKINLILYHNNMRFDLFGSFIQS